MGQTLDNVIGIIELPIWFLVYHFWNPERELAKAEGWGLAKTEGVIGIKSEIRRILRKV